MLAGPRVHPAIWEINAILRLYKCWAQLDDLENLTASQTSFKEIMLSTNKNLVFAFRSILILIGGFLISCHPNSLSDDEVRMMLIDKMMVSEAVSNIKNENLGVVVMKIGYCDQIDCEKFFKEYSGQVTIYDREDVFMRMLLKYVVIERIEIKNGEGRIEYEVRNGPNLAKHLVTN